MPQATAASDAESLEALRQLLADPSIGRAWLIRHDTQPVGYVLLAFVHSIEFGGRCAFVDELYVWPESRGQGVGRRALELVTVAARELGVRMLLLEVSPENERACGLYRSAGFGLRKYRLMTKRLDR